MRRHLPGIGEQQSLRSSVNSFHLKLQIEIHQKILSSASNQIFKFQAEFIDN
jgi:hypothetical protein